MTPAFIKFCEDRFNSEFPLVHPNIPMFFSNVPVADSVATFVALHVMASEDTVPISLGIESKSRNVGIIQIDVLVPKDKGAGNAYKMAYDAGMIFKRKDLAVGSEGLIVFKDPAVQDRGEVRGRHKHMVRIPYRYDFADFTIN